MHHPWLPADDPANQTCHPFYLPRPEEIQAKMRAIRSGELVVAPDGSTIEGPEARRIHERNLLNKMKRVQKVIEVKPAMKGGSSKICRSCNRNLDTISFSRKTASRDGLQSNCRECVRIAEQRRRNNKRSAVA